MRPDLNIGVRMCFGLWIRLNDRWCVYVVRIGTVLMCWNDWGVTGLLRLNGRYLTILACVLSGGLVWLCCVFCFFIGGYVIDSLLFELKGILRWNRLIMRVGRRLILLIRISGLVRSRNAVVRNILLLVGFVMVVRNAMCDRRLRMRRVSIMIRGLRFLLVLSWRSRIGWLVRLLNVLMSKLDLFGWKVLKLNMNLCFGRCSNYWL